MFVLQLEDGKFVAAPGHDKSYVTNLQDARTYNTREQAENDRCVENEKIVSIYNLMYTPTHNRQ